MKLLMRGGPPPTRMPVSSDGSRANPGIKERANPAVCAVRLYPLGRMLTRTTTLSAAVGGSRSCWVTSVFLRSRWAAGFLTGSLSLLGRRPPMLTDVAGLVLALAP